jgi:guanosine-3',5'-bis(diphosphate) 3'-pyrophosphohydrolase
MTLIRAIHYAMKKHEGQKRIGGKPYITHPFEVSKILEEKGFDTPYLIAGLFHDLKEDTDATDEEIIEHGGQEVLTAVTLMTKEKGYDMKEYILRISQNLIAKMVKLADRLHNLLSAVVASEKFRRRYIQETEGYYLDLAKGTVFENDIKEALIALKATIAQ